ncbi:MAG: nitroreductase family protein [Candidatus Izemoplasmataceae bacterium]
MKDAIKKRISARSYLKRPLSSDDEKTVKRILDDVQEKKGPFGHNVRFFTLPSKGEGGKYLGTYGFIKQAPYFIGGVVENNFEGMVDYGFLFEEVILRLTEKDFGTVWLGGTFKRERFEFEVDVKEGEIIPAISPVGHSAEQSMRERVLRGFTKAKTRKFYDELFFTPDLGAVPEDNVFAEYLELLRLAPSASNKQPWRVILEDNVFHLYLERTKGYAKHLPTDIQAIDIGIALAHLYLPIKEDGYTPEFTREKPRDVEGWEYVLSLEVN